MPLFMSLRAAVRAHVTATAASCVSVPDDRQNKTDQARLYLDLARRVLEPACRRLIAVGGLSGTGKSTIARKLAALVGARPGARVLRSDVIRKRLWGMLPETPLPAVSYEAPISCSVYSTIRRKAAAALRAGYSVIIDAVSLEEHERRSFAKVAEDAHVPFSGIWLEAAPEVLAARLGARVQDASDASIEVLRRQLSVDAGVIDWQKLNANGDEDTNTAAALKMLGMQSEQQPS